MSYVDTTNFVCKIQGEGKVPHHIKGLAVNKPREIMGVWQNLAENNGKQIEEMIKKHIGKIISLVY
mgnify:CR=1 FL=1